MQTDERDYAGEIERAGRTYALAVADEMALEDQRPIVKQAAVLRLIGTPNPATGKPHSASSAEAVVESDEEYVTHRVQQRQAVYAKIVAAAQYEAAKARARLAAEVA